MIQYIETIVGGPTIGALIIIDVTAIQERIRWGFWPRRYTPEKMRQRINGSTKTSRRV